MKCFNRFAGVFLVALVALSGVPGTVYADPADQPAPRCIGDICLGDESSNLDLKPDSLFQRPEYTYAVLEEAGSFRNFGDARLVNSVILNNCERPGTVRQIHRVLGGEEAPDFVDLLGSWEIALGRGKVRAIGLEHQRFRYWYWADAGVRVEMAQESSSHPITIDLYSELSVIDDEACRNRQAYRLHASLGLTPSRRPAQWSMRDASAKR